MQATTSLKSDQEKPNQKDNGSRNLAIEAEICRGLLKRCQADHISGALFPLNEILISPKLLARIQAPGPDDVPQYLPALYQALPSLYDSPDIVLGFPYPTITIEKALSLSPRLVISGYPGTGKTTAITDFVSRICSKNPTVGVFSNSLPVFLHVRDLVFNGASKNDPFAPLLRYLTILTKRNDEKIIKSTLSSAANSGNLILFLDGLEETSPKYANGVLQWLDLLLKQFPLIKVIATTIPQSSSMLFDLGFYELSIAPWTNNERKEFINKFAHAWNDSYSQADEAAFVPLWLQTAELHKSPLEITLFCWAAFTGNSLKLEGAQIFAPYLLNLSSHQVTSETLTAIASSEASNNLAGSSQSVIEFLLSKDPLFKKSNADETLTAPIAASKNSSKPAAVYTPKSLLNELLEIGLLYLSASGKVFIKNQHLCAALCSRDASIKIPISWNMAANSSFSDSLVEFACPTGKAEISIKNWIEEQDTPFFRNLILISHWLTAFPAANRKLLPLIYKKVIPIIQKGGLPVSLLIKLTKPFLLSEDPSTIVLFKNLASSHDPVHRQTAAFGLSFYATSEAEQLLLNLALDRDQEVQQLACISLSKIWSHNAQKQLVSLVISALPETREIIAECLAFVPGDGQELLKELSTLEKNPEARKAAVEGLFLVNKDWSNALIKKINIDDSEWIVRDAATNSIKLSSLDYLFRPRRKVGAAHLPWLIKFAAARRMGIYADDFPADILMLVAKEGNSQVQIAALNALSEDHSTTTNQFLLQIMQNERGLLQETAYQTLLKKSRLTSITN